MLGRYNYLKDRMFLKEVDESKNKEQHIKVTVLNFQEKPIKEIQGRIVGGTINLDGNSAVRRTCNPNIIVDDYSRELLNVDGLLSMNKKVFIEIGFTNLFSSYLEHDIIWFPLGVFVIINSNCTHSKDSLNISLQLKDKMCLLNGDCGGVIPSAVSFHEFEAYDYEINDYYISQPKVYQIIQELVHHWGGERLDKIIISDVPDKIKQVMKWTGDKPLYIYNETLNDMKSPYINVGLEYETLIREVYESLYKDGISFSDEEWENLYKKEIETENSIIKQIQKSILKCYNGCDIGFIYTDFVYPGELICNSGETIVSVLDKIKNTLGNFEYFYDIHGNFIFREIKNYLNTNKATSILNKIENNSNYAVNYWNDESTFSFDNNVLISSYSNTPQYNTIKNDFVVWGKRKGVTGVDLPIRYHLAIDKKPSIGNKYKVYFYEDDFENIKKAKKVLKYPASDISIVNWSDIQKMEEKIKCKPIKNMPWEIGEFKPFTEFSVDNFSDKYTFKSRIQINPVFTSFSKQAFYKMAYKGKLFSEDVEIKVDVDFITQEDRVVYGIVTTTDGKCYLYSLLEDDEKLKEIFENKKDVEMLVWYEAAVENQLFNENHPSDVNIVYEIAEVKNKDSGDIIYSSGYYKYNCTSDGYELIDPKNIKEIVTQDWRSELYFSSLEASMYGTDSGNYGAEILVEWPKLYDISYQPGDKDEIGEVRKSGWYENTIDGVDIDYFLDFIDANSAEIGKYSVDNIGRRSKVVKDDKINCIFEPDIPNIIWINGEEEQENLGNTINDILKQGYACYQASSVIWSYIVGGGYYNSAYNLIQDLLYQHTHFNETVSVTLLPIYHLEPNTRVTINDELSGIFGDYIIKSFSIPLDINGTMTISCAKILDKI